MTPLLTPAQEMTLYLVTQGMSDEEIAVELGVAHGTVKYRTTVLRSKFGVSRRRHLIKAGNKVLDAASRSAIRSRIRQQKEEK